MNGGFPGFGPGHWGLGLVIWVLLIVGIVAIYFAVRKKSGYENSAGTRHKSAMRILQERYARGEIDDDEYAEKKRELER